MEIKQRKVCGDCRCFSRVTKTCGIGYNTKFKSGALDITVDAIPLEPCPKPLTVDEYMDAIKNYRKPEHALSVPEKKIALYTILTKSMCVLIPKRKSDGFLKSCFGFDSKNETSKLFDEIKPDWFLTGDYCDLDGYLSLDLRLPIDHPDFKSGIQETVQALLKVFPYVTEFIEDDKKFWAYLLKKN